MLKEFGDVPEAVNQPGRSHPAEFGQVEFLQPLGQRLGPRSAARWPRGLRLPPKPFTRAWLFPIGSGFLRDGQDGVQLGCHLWVQLVLGH